MNEINIKLCAHRKKAKAARRVECSVCFSAVEEGEWGESREREVEVLKRPIKPEKETQLTNICSAWVTGMAEIHAMRSSHSLLTQQLCLIFTRPLKSNKTRNYAQTVCECFWYLMRLLCVLESPISEHNSFKKGLHNWCVYGRVESSFAPSTTAIHDLHLRTKLNEHEAWKKNNFSSQVAWSEASNSSRSTANSLSGFSRYQESIWTFSTTTTFGSRAEPRKQKKKRFQLFEYSFWMPKWAHSLPCDHVGQQFCRNWIHYLLHIASNES